MKKLTTLIKLTVITVIGATFLMTAPLVHADAKSALCEGAGLVNGTTGCDTPIGSPDVNSTLKSAINLFGAIIGIIAVVMIMISGIKYITSQGDPAQINSAKNTALYAAIGLVIVALSQVIVRFVLSRFTK